MKLVLFKIKLKNLFGTQKSTQKLPTKKKHKNIYTVVDVPVHPPNFEH